MKDLDKYVAFEKASEIMYIITAMISTFPDFSPIEIDDRNFIHQRLWDYQPDTSELNFTNLFIWRNHYKFRWSVYRNWLLIIGGNSDSGIQALPPIGPSPRTDVTRTLLDWIKSDQGVSTPHVDRADQRLVAELQDSPGYVIEPAREHFDYLYTTDDLIQLSGKAYRQKRNHLNYLFRTHPIVYKRMDESDVPACLTVTDQWCEERRCAEDLNLASEWEATRQAITHFPALKLDGGIIQINGQVEAFTLGERLRSDTAVVHVEKANMAIRGLYAVVNQQYCENQWKDLPWINREQDLGEPGLRKAKLSYNPTRLIEKFRITLKG
jgi:uncharacterized protein